MATWDVQWSLVERGVEKGARVELVELVPVLSARENQILGPELLRRATEKDAEFTESDACALFEERDHLPIEWEDYVLLFPATKYSSLEYGTAIVALSATTLRERKTGKRIGVNWSMMLIAFSGLPSRIQEWHASFRFLRMKHAS